MQLSLNIYQYFKVLVKKPHRNFAFTFETTSCLISTRDVYSNITSNNNNNVDKGDSSAMNMIMINLSELSNGHFSTADMSALIFFLFFF